MADAGELSGEKRTTRAEQPLISVIVPTKDRPAALRRCLEALSAQTTSDVMEVIVVDDGSHAADEVANLVALHHRARLIRRDGAGPAAARNAGVRHAHGRVLCFTDDDCAPDPQWAERLAQAIERGVDVAAGVTVSSGGALGEASEIVARAPAHAPGADARVMFAPSNNLAGGRALFESIPFDERYPTAAGEDRDWCARVIAGGYALRLEPSSRVVHHQELNLQRFLRQQFRYGEGAYRFRRGTGERRPLEARAFYAALLRRGFDKGWVVGLLVSVAQLATAAGFGLAWVRRRQNDRAFTPRAASLPQHSRADTE